MEFVQATYLTLLVTQALHLLHHRLVKRHISFAEVASSLLLCVSPSAPVPGWLLGGAHLAMVGVQVVGSIWIRRLAPEWERDARARRSPSVADASE